MKVFFLFFFVLNSTFAQAGGSRFGNGGDGVYCAGSATRPVLQLLDFYELSFFDHEEATLGLPSDDPLAKVGFVLDWMKQYSPLRAQRYQENLRNFFARTTWVQSDLQDIPDSQHVVL